MKLVLIIIGFIAIPMEIVLRFVVFEAEYDMIIGFQKVKS